MRLPVGSVLPGFLVLAMGLRCFLVAPGVRALPDGLPQNPAIKSLGKLWPRHDWRTASFPLHHLRRCPERDPARRSDLEKDQGSSATDGSGPTSPRPTWPAVSVFLPFDRQSVGERGWGRGAGQGFKCRSELQKGDRKGTVKIF